MKRRRFLALAGSVLTVPSSAWASRPVAGLRRLNLISGHTGERFDGPYRDDQGAIPSAMAELAFFLRDFHCGKESAIDVGVLDFLAAVMDAVGATRATVLSGYRTVETNRLLARTTFGVADNSQHLYGRALDIRIDSRLTAATQAARAMRRGGVGWYPHSGFIHLDTGPVRTWTLDNMNLDRLLQHLLAKGGLSISSNGQLFLGNARRPPSVAQRLALHRAIAKADLAALRH